MVEWHLGQEEGRKYDKIHGVVIVKPCLARVIGCAPET